MPAAIHPQMNGFIKLYSKVNSSVKPFTANKKTPTQNPMHNGQFQKDDYLYWLEKEFHDTLRIINKVTKRGGVTRKPFQAERTILKQFGLLTGNMRTGVGLEINWPSVLAALEPPT